MLKHYLVTGGAGFIGSNYVHRLLSRGERVTIYDNLSRAGAPLNIDWIRGNHGDDSFQLVVADVLDADKLKSVTQDVDVILHLAGQVAVTTSVVDPRSDFEDNALGTFNVLEAARLSGRKPIILYASTNKVYGGMEEVRVEEGSTCYKYADLLFGVPETQPLDFHSPYGCSKGAGDQYVRDYHRIYGLNSVVFRQSCISAEQKIVTPFGKKPISALSKGDLVHSGWGWTRVRRVWQTGVKPVRKLRTLHGLNITLTEDHRVVRPHGLFINRDFAYGDFIAVLPETLYMPDWEEIPDRVLEPEEYLSAVEARTDDSRCRNRAKQIASALLPLQGDRLLAVTEVVGWLFGDGHLGIHHRKSRKNLAYTVQFFGLDKELEQITKRMNWLGLPISGIIRSQPTSELLNGHIIEGVSCRIQQQSIPEFTMFELMGVPVGDKVRIDYRLPAWIREGHTLVKRAFLRGFFGAELGKVQPHSYLAPSFTQSKDIDYLENGRYWMQDLRDLIANFGIETSYFEGKPETYKRGTTVQMIVRLLGGKDMFPRLAGIGYAFSPERSHQLNALLRWEWMHTTPDFFEETVSLYRADGELFWDSLAGTEDLGEHPVYELEVEDNAHLFVAGGVHVSNCIYGPRQFGIEDQGWVAWFVIAALLGKPITIYGNGKQVRDVLYVDDLLDAYDAAIANITAAAGRVYNIGGGPANTMSIWQEFGPLLESLLGHKIPVARGDWRPGDQHVYISDIRKAERELGWQPHVSVEDGVRSLFEWVKSNKQLFL